MNLARVEYYLSDVLSCIETRSAMQLHSNGVPLEGTTGTSIRAELPLPENLFIVGTINIDETTNPVSDKVLDRASVIDMSAVDLPGFLASLEAQDSTLAAARAACEGKLTELNDMMKPHGLGFGYRVAEEFLRYHSFATAHLGSGSDDVIDQLLVQKVLVKLRGAERQRALLTGIGQRCKGLVQASAMVERLLNDLDEFGSFQAMR
jgi:5-methylcytosine-specific restriction enzyme B